MQSDHETGLQEYIVDFFFPELKGPGIYQSAAVSASDFGTAFNRAWTDVRKRPAIKGRRINTVKLTAIRSEKAQAPR